MQYETLLQWKGLQAPKAFAQEFGPWIQLDSYGFAKATRFSVCRGTAVGAAPLQTEKPVHFPCPARLDFAEPHVQIEEEAVSTEPCGIY